MRRFSIILIVFCLSLHSLAVIAGAEIRPKVEIDPPFGTASDIFSLTVTVENRAVASLSPPEFKNSKDFQIQSRGTSTRREWINGRERYQVIFSFVVTPDPSLSAGNHTLPDGDMLIDGEVVDLTGPTLKITPDSQRTKSERNAESSGLDFTQVVDNVRPYVGQQIQYRTEMVSSRAIRSASISDVQLPGILRESLGEYRQTERLVGRATRTSIIESLFPTRPGVFEVPERVLNVEVQAKRFRSPLAGRRAIDPNDPDFFAKMLQDDFPMFDTFSFVRRKLTAEPIHLDVRPLPDPEKAGLDHAMNGYVPVGKVEVRTEIQGEKIELGESVTLKITLSGTANLRPFELPEVASTAAKHFKIYADKPELVATPSARGVSFQKTFTISFVPQHVGQLFLPVYEIVHFDPQTERYSSYKTPEQPITVLPDRTGRTVALSDQPPPNMVIPENPKSTIDEGPKDLAPQYSAALFTRPVPPVDFSLYLLLLSLLPIGAILQLLGRIGIPTAFPKRGELARAKRALLAADSLEGRYSAWRSFLGSYFGVLPATLELERISELTREHSLEHEIRERLISVTKTLEQAVYGKTELSASDAKQLSTDIARSVSDLGRKRKQIKSASVALFLVPLSLPLLPSPSFAADFTSEVTAGNMSFRRGDFEEAKDFYLRAKSLFGESPELLLNLGNTYFRLHEVGRAVDALEQAAIFSPRDPNIQKSLFWVLSQNEELSAARRHHVEEIYRLPLNTVEMQLAVLASWSLLLFLLIRATHLASGLTAANCLLAFLLCCTLGYQGLKRKSAVEAAPALVLQDGSKVFAGPDETSQVIAILPDGAGVPVQDKVPSWIRVSIQGGRTGWMREQDARQVYDG